MSYGFRRTFVPWEEILSGVNPAIGEVELSREPRKGGMLFLFEVQRVARTEPIGARRILWAILIHHCLVRHLILPQCYLAFGCP